MNFMTWSEKVYIMMVRNAIEYGRHFEFQKGKNVNLEMKLTCAVIFLNKSFLALSILLPLVAPNEIFSSNF